MHATWKFDALRSSRIFHVPSPKFPKQRGLPWTSHGDYNDYSMRKPMTRWNMPVSLLQVCRQIYHETALKPFSQTIFMVQEKWHAGSQAFLEALVPAQARAIKHIRFMCVDGLCPAYKVMQHPKGLETLVFQLVEDFEEEEPYRFDFMLEHLNKNLKRVKKFDIKSVRICMLVDDTFTAAEKKLLAEHLEHAETSSRQMVA
jgi:hypothetical protein